MHASQQAFAYILSYFGFSLSSNHVLYLWRCVLSAYLSDRRASWNTIYKASVCCFPRRNDGPLAKDLPKSRLFITETATEWKYAGQSKSLLMKRYAITNTEFISNTCPSLHFCDGCVHSEGISASRWRDVLQPVALLHLRSITNSQRLTFNTCDESVWVRGNSRWLLIMAVVPWQVVWVPFITGWSFSRESTSPGGRDAHFTFRPLINSTRASSQQWPSVVQSTII